MPGSTWDVLNFAETAEQVGKVVEHRRAVSTQLTIRPDGLSYRYCRDSCHECEGEKEEEEAIHLPAVFPEDGTEILAGLPLLLDLALDLLGVKVGEDAVEEVLLRLQPLVERRLPRRAQAPLLPVLVGVTRQTILAAPVILVTRAWKIKRV